MGDPPRQPPSNKPAKLTRRGLLNGIVAGVGAGLVGDARDTHGERTSATRRATVADEYAPERAPDYYPPARNGIRGDHDGCFDFAHELRNGKRHEDLGPVTETGEHYDLVVVGGGVSGLAAAYLYSQRRERCRILVLENHDDFGGHATRNEFMVGDRKLLSYGGSQSIASPETFSPVAKRLLGELGVDVGVFHQAFDRKLYANLGTGLFFNRETYGRDHLTTGMYTSPWPELLRRAPLSDVVRRDIVRVYTDRRDYLSGMSQDDKIALLRRTSYAEYLTKHCRVAPEALGFFQSFPHDLFTVGIDGVSAWSCFHAVDDFGAFIYPGFDGLGLPERLPGEPYIYHFPDGNASVARLLVRALNPAAVPGSSMHDVVLAKVDYSRLDAPDSRVKIRLNSSVIHARHRSPGDHSSGVEIVYARGGRLQSVTARHCVLACYNSMIPYLCPELPREQKKALAYLVRMPLVYTHVALRNWMPFAKLGVHQIVAPSAYHNYTALDFPVSLGGYECPKHPEEPAVLFMLRVPCRPGLPRRDQNRIGRWELMNTPYDVFADNIRDQLGRMPVGTGFDPAVDIVGITVNRWAHGYSFVPNYLFDPDWAHEEKPWVIGRRPWGCFAIANSDAGASAYMDVAIDQAWRAVNELTTS